MDSKKGKYLKSYIESKNGGFRINGADADSVGAGFLIFIGGARGNGKNEWEFTPYNDGGRGSFIVTDECVERNLNHLYVDIITGRNSACEFNPYDITKTDMDKWIEAHKEL